MKVLVTGGAGYVGTSLVPQLRNAGHEVVVLDSLRHGQPVFLDRVRDDGFAFQRGDVRKVEDVAAAIDGCDAVVHLAAIVGAPACHAEPELAHSVNVKGLRVVAAAAQEAGAVFVFPSTDSCYGAQPSGECDEDTPLEPLSEYGQHKAHGESYVRAVVDDHSILRFATAFGVSPRMRTDLLVNDFVLTGLRNRSLVVYEAGFRRTFLHVADIGRAVVQALEDRDVFGGRTFNVGDDNLNFDKAELAKAVAGHTGCSLNMAGEGTDLDGRDYWVSHTRIAPHFKASITLDEGIEELLRAYDTMTFSDPFRNAL